MLIYAVTFLFSWLEMMFFFVVVNKWGLNSNYPSIIEQQEGKQKKKKRAGGSFYVYKNIYNWIIDEFDVENLSTHSLMTVQIFDHAQFNDALV